MTNWTTSDMPSQRGRTAVVTGTGGLGLETAVALAAGGARVVIAGRDAGKGDAAVARVRAATPDADVRFAALDLASLASVAAFGARLRDELDGLDLLVNNAGVMTPPQRRTTADGFELQLGVNHLGHVALTAELLPLLQRGTDPRVVTLSSVAARSGAIDFDDLQAERAYDAMRVYAQSKLACLMFARELHRRSVAEGWGVKSIGAHPGVARTELIPNSAAPRSASNLVRRFAPFLFQPADRGALPTLYAATAPEAQGGGYYGPNRLGETRGRPAPARVPEAATDAAASARLWDVSAALTGARFGAPAARA